MNNKIKAFSNIFIGIVMYFASYWFWKIPLFNDQSSVGLIIFISAGVVKVFGIILFIKGIINLFNKQDANIVGINIVPKPPQKPNPTIKQALIWICSGVFFWILAFLLLHLCDSGDFVCGIRNAMAACSGIVISIVLIIIGLIKFHKSQKK